MTEVTEAPSTFEILKQRKLERMRQGSAACSITHLVSDPEIRIALVPLNEAEYLNSLDAGAHIDLPDNLLAATRREEAQRIAVLQAACREPGELTKNLFPRPEDLGVLDATDINHLWDHYLEMAAQFSPSMEELSEEDFADLKKVWEEIDWNELNGAQWYAAKRFLVSISPLLLKAKSLGSS